MGLGQFLQKKVVAPKVIFFFFANPIDAASEDVV